MNAAFRTSLEIEVEVRSEDPRSGAQRLTTRAFVTMVAVDAEGRPAPIPPLVAANDEERERASAAELRRRARLARRQ